MLLLATKVWEQRKLGTITDTYSGGTPQVSVKDYYSNNEIPFIRSSDIHKNKTELYISSKGLENSSAKLVSKGHILYALYGATSGEVDVSKIDGAINQAVLCINAHNDLNYFLMLFLSKNKDKIVRKYIQGGQGNLSASIIKKIKVFTTSKLEETKISNLVKILSDIIALYDRKTKLIKQIQSSFLDCFFSETNNVTSLNHFLRIRNGYAFKSSELTENGEIPVVKISNIGSNKPFTFTTKAKSKEQFTLYPNDIIIALSGATAGKINQVANKYPLYYQNQRVGFFEIKNDRLNCEYLNSFLHSKKFKSQLQKTLVAGAQPNITPKDIEKIKIPFLEYELQQTIGQVNKYLFELQRINKDKLTLLNKIKKTLLNNMFV